MPKFDISFNDQERFSGSLIMLFIFTTSLLMLSNSGEKVIILIYISLVSSDLRSFQMYIVHWFVLFSVYNRMLVPCLFLDFWVYPFTTLWSLREDLVSVLLLVSLQSLMQCYPHSRCSRSYFLPSSLSPCLIYQQILWGPLLKYIPICCVLIISLLSQRI